MSFVRGALTVAFVANVACVSHAKRMAKEATLGVKAQLAQVNPAFAASLGDHFARGLVGGAIAELGSDENVELVRAVVDATSSEAAREMLIALTSDSGRFQMLVEGTVDGAVTSFGRHLAEDTVLRTQLSSLTHELSASAVQGARDALGDVFPQCAGVADRRRCIEDQVSGVSRAAARGMMAEFVGAARWPMLGLAFLAGVLIALLVVNTRARAMTTHVVARTRVPARHHHPRA
jgi:hypothetical protein